MLHCCSLPFSLRNAIVTLLAMASVTVVACEELPRSETKAGTNERNVATGQVARLSEMDAIENPISIGPKLISGGEPRGERAFDVLDELGVKTIISVDGARPNIEAAKKRGMRYIHLPFGYDSIDPELANRIAKAVTDAKGKVFVHCHHGKHRGPAAVAIAGKTLYDWNSRQSEAFLNIAGTSPAYDGLYKSVDSFVCPDDETLAQMSGKFDSVAERPKIVETMAMIDRRWDGLKLSQKIDFGVPPDHPDIDPPHEALQMFELLQEFRRLDASESRGETFDRELEKSLVAAKALHDALADRNETRVEETLKNANVAFNQLRDACKACHDSYRN